MAGFEYDVFSIAWGHGGGKAETKIRNELNARGADGWELVGMTRDESPDDDHAEEVVLFVFKRPAKKGKHKKDKKNKKDKKHDREKKPKSEKAPETQKVPNVQKPPPPDKPRKKRKK